MAYTTTFGTGSNVAAGTNPTPTYPAAGGMGAGKLAILICACASGSVNDWLTPDGSWTQRGTQISINSEAATLNIFSKILNGSETAGGTVTVTSTGSLGRRACLIFTVDQPGNAGWGFENIDGQTQATNITSISDNDVTTAGPDRLALNIILYPILQTGGQEAFTGTTGGTWVADGYYESGNYPTLSVQKSAIAVAGTIGGGADATITSSTWLIWGAAIWGISPLPEFTPVRNPVRRWKSRTPAIAQPALGDKEQVGRDTTQYDVRAPLPPVHRWKSRTPVRWIERLGDKEQVGRDTKDNIEAPRPPPRRWDSRTPAISQPAIGDDIDQGSNTDFATNPTPLYPAGTLAGSLLILQCIVRGDAAGTLTPPAGWTQLYDSGYWGASVNQRHQIWRKDVVTSTESGSITVTTAGTAGRRFARIYGFTGSSDIWAFESSSSAVDITSATTISDVDVTTLGSARRALNLIDFATVQAAAADYAGETGGTWISTAFSNLNNPSAQLFVADMASAGTVGGGSDASISASPWHIWGFAIFNPLEPDNPPLPPVHRDRYRVPLLALGDNHVAAVAAVTDDNCGSPIPPPRRSKRAVLVIAQPALGDSEHVGPDIRDSILGPLPPTRRWRSRVPALWSGDAHSAPVVVPTGEDSLLGQRPPPRILRPNHPVRVFLPSDIRSPTVHGIFEAFPLTNMTAAKARIDIFAAAGFKVVLNYSVPDPYLGGQVVTSAELGEYADYVQSKGMKIIWVVYTWHDDDSPVTLFSNLATDYGASTNAQIRAGLFTQLKSHPATWGYYIADEPAATELTRQTELHDNILLTDSTHPLLSVMTANQVNDGTAATLEATVTQDGMDWYPIGAAIATTRVTDTRFNQFCVYAAGNSKPIVQALQCIDMAVSYPPLAGQYPTSHWPTTYELRDQLDRIKDQAARTGVQLSLAMWFSYYDIVNNIGGSAQISRLAEVIKNETPLYLRDYMVQADTETLTQHDPTWELFTGSTFKFSVNSLYTDHGAGFDCLAHRPEPVPNDQFARATYSVMGVGYGGVAVRGGNGVRGYYFLANNADCKLFVDTVQLGSTGAAFASTDTIELRVSGSTLIPMKNGVLIDPPGIIVDTTYASGKVGLAANAASGTTRINDWFGGALETDVGGDSSLILPIRPPRLSRRQAPVRVIDPGDRHVVTGAPPAGEDSISGPIPPRRRWRSRVNPLVQPISGDIDQIGGDTQDGLTGPRPPAHRWKSVTPILNFLGDTHVPPAVIVGPDELQAPIPVFPPRPADRRRLIKYANQPDIGPPFDLPPPPPPVSADVSEGARGGKGFTTQWRHPDYHLEEEKPHRKHARLRELLPEAVELEKDDLVAELERHRGRVSVAKLIANQRIADMDAAGVELLRQLAMMDEDAIAILMLSEL